MKGAWQRVSVSYLGDTWAQGRGLAVRMGGDRAAVRLLCRRGMLPACATAFTSLPSGRGVTRLHQAFLQAASPVLRLHVPAPIVTRLCRKTPAHHHRLPPLVSPALAGVCYVLLFSLGLNFLRGVMAPRYQERCTWAHSAWTRFATAALSTSISAAAALHDRHLNGLDPLHTLEVGGGRGTGEEVREVKGEGYPSVPGRQCTCPRSLE